MQIKKVKEVKSNKLFFHCVLTLENSYFLLQKSIFRSIAIQYYPLDSLKHIKIIVSIVTHVDESRLKKTHAASQDRVAVREELESLRMERILRRQYLRHKQTQQFYKSMQMLSVNAKGNEECKEPFEDYSLFVYRQTAPDFKDRVKQLEMKILYPVS